MGANLGVSISTPSILYITRLPFTLEPLSTININEGQKKVLSEIVVVCSPYINFLPLS